MLLSAVLLLERIYWKVLVREGFDSGERRKTGGNQQSLNSTHSSRLALSEVIFSSIPNDV